MTIKWSKRDVIQRFQEAMESIKSSNNQVNGTPNQILNNALAKIRNNGGR